MATITPLSKGVVFGFSSLLLLVQNQHATKAFQPVILSPTTSQRPCRAAASSSAGSSLSPSTTHRNMVSQIRDADLLEQMIGGERYEMVPLPDSLVDTTLFVGNLNEFVTDDILSSLFTQKRQNSDSSLTSTSQQRFLGYSVPACVARKANAASLEYGFVSFASPEEKEAAIIKFHGYELNGRKIKVEEIRDDPKRGRVRVPEKLVAYTCGLAKKTRDGRTNTLRRSSGDDRLVSKKQKQKLKKQKQQRKKNKKATKNQDPFLKFNKQEQGEINRSLKRGYITLDGTGYRRGRKSSRLASYHRQWCDDNNKPQIILCKASGGRQYDNVIVDLSPLRIIDQISLLKSNSNNNIDDDNDVDDIYNNQFDDFLTKWKAEILIAANNAGMELRNDYVEDNTSSSVVADDDDDDDDDNLVTDFMPTDFTMNVKDFTIEPISNLPSISLGVFEGERCNAKLMVKNLATIWNIVEIDDDEDGYGDDDFSYCSVFNDDDEDNNRLDQQQQLHSRTITKTKAKKWREQNNNNKHSKHKRTRRRNEMKKSSNRIEDFL